MKVHPDSTQSATVLCSPHLHSNVIYQGPQHSLTRAAEDNAAFRIEDQGLKQVSALELATLRAPKSLAEIGSTPGDWIQNASKLLKRYDQEWLRQGDEYVRRCLGNGRNSSCS